MFTELDVLVSDIKLNADKFFNKGNKAAGTRARKGLQRLKSLAQAIRNKIQEVKVGE